MSWFTRKRTDGTVANDGLNALDRLTQKASVGLSRRSFLKKAGIGVAATGLSVIGMTTGVAVTQAQTIGICGWMGECRRVRQCVSCTGTQYQPVYHIYKYNKCCSVNSCTTTCDYYTTQSAGSCGSCAI